jgi:hypothetical protein
MPAFQNAVGSVLRSGLTFLSKRRLSQIGGSLSVPGLSAPVEIICCERASKWMLPRKAGWC